MADWLTWQIVDSAFPTGAFAHSLGLEAAWQQGEVEDVGALRRFMEATVRQTASASVPLVNAAYRSPARLEELDLLADAFLVNSVANRASRIQGRTLAATAARIWPGTLAAGVPGRAADLCAHIAPLAGVVFRAIDLPHDVLVGVVLFSAARGVASAAVRLGIVGGYEAQRLQFECIPMLERMSRRCQDFTESDLAQTEPILDLLHAAHGRLYSRLFQS